MLLKELLRNIILKEDLNRNAFVIDNNGVFHKTKWHGDIVFQFKYLNDTAESMFGNKNEIKRAAINGNRNLMNLIDASGFVRGGVWSPSKRELYFVWFKPTRKALIGIIKYISKYKPKGIYVDDLVKRKFINLSLEDFIDDYL